MSRKHPGSKFYKAMDARLWALVRKQAFRRDGFRCQSCGLAGRLECHHILPLENGGAEYDPANLKTLCRSCHVSHHRRPVNPEIAAWRDFLEKV